MVFHASIRSTIEQRWSLVGTLILALTCWDAAYLAADRPDAPELRQIAVPRQLIDPIATRLNLHYHSEAGVTITADDRGGGSLLVMAPPSIQKQIAEDAAALVQRLAPEANSGQPTQMNVHLIHVSWREAEDTLRTIAGSNVPVTTSRNGERASFQINLGDSGSSHIDVDRRANQVAITALPQSHAMWQQVLSAIDSPTRFTNERTEILRLVHAEPAPVQRAIRLLRSLDERNAVQPVRRITRPASTAGKPTFQSAGFKTVAFAQNTDETTEEDSPTPSADVAASDGDDDTDGGVIGDTEIQIVPDSGLIIIKGAKRDVERIKEVIAEIEAQAKITQPEVEVRQLQHADSNAVATLLAQLYEDVLSARQGDVSITSLDAPNALLLIGRAEAIKAVMELVDKIDQPIPETDRLRVFRLKHASANDAEATIREFFTAVPGEDSDQRPGLGNRVRISADYRTNSLIIAASPRDMSEVTRLVEQLDVRQSASTSQIRIFPLRNARAEDLAPVLEDAISAEPENVPDDTTTKSASISIVSLGNSGNAILESGILSGTVITADSNANAIVVRAPSEGMSLIAELIRQLDQAPGIDSLVKVFTIENSDAAQLTTALQNLFGDDAGTSGTSIGAGNQAGLPSLSAAESALVPLRFSTDARTNSIIASGSAEDLEVVESILLRLDSAGFAERITEVIWLKNQIAINIATAIQEYVSSRQQSQNIIPQLQQGLGPYDLPDRDLIVVAEGQTNSLLLSVSPRMYEEVRQLIDRLDRRPPMVLIKTLIAEVALSDGFELGGEFGLQDSILFDRGIAGTASNPGFNFNNAGLPNLNTTGREDLASQGVTTFGVAQSVLDSTNNGGFVFSAASESISMFLRTLQTADRLQILSRPEIMTADNTEGFVQVGQQFPRPTEISTTAQGQTLIGIEDVDIGIILRVTPRVGADGLILMAIDATRSAINNTVGQNIGFDNNNNPIFVPAIDTTTAQATVTAFDGQTVVFGGLITKRRDNSTKRVPYLADIPLLGTFFKYDREREFRTELLVVMTPVLVTGNEDLEYVKQAESSRMSWCLADVVEAHGDEGLSGGYGLWGPAIGPTIYPDVHPTVDVFPAADMPKHSAVRTGIPMYQGTAVPAEAVSPTVPGIELAPGESIISDEGMLGSEYYAPLPANDAPGVWSPDSTSIPAPANELPVPSTEILPAPVQQTLPPVPVSGASAASPTQTNVMKTASTGPPASLEPPKERPGRWSNFNGKLSSFISPSK
ncbi:secretin N-terminal domain-containing protein [Aporhodopirellula aestuarii]|uniref:General secretion pathway protein GspD n=1 Tax=Aporhodopirellula aestuarii TaxID=2950107 RepID=A0ABT0UCF4_9BACT|nr:secretin N-terminal domain-containing protein [Aporhodopirellula aestuarii]MCM2374409.1 general secretion pathway protein GspD [Aporhodopirellula aestuarii]